jgi:hypothetical protein
MEENLWKILLVLAVIVLAPPLAKTAVKIGREVRES